MSDTNKLKPFLDLAIPVIVSVLFLTVVSFNLQSNPMKGIADNHDFSRMMTWIGVVYPPHQDISENYINWINRYYVYQSPRVGEVYSSELLFLFIARATSHLIGEPVFDIKILGFVHTMFFSLTVFFVVFYIQRINKHINLIVIPFIFLVLTDTTYVAYFNSFYQEPAGLIFFFAFIATYLKLIAEKSQKVSQSTFLVLIAFACLVITAKAQYFPLVFPIIVVMLLLKHKSFSKKVLYLSSAFLVLLSLGYYIFATPPIIKKWNVYNTLFAQLLGSTENLPRAVNMLDLDYSLTKYAGIPAYFSDNGIDDQAVQKHLSSQKYLPIVTYYLFTPIETINLVALLSKMSFTSKIDFLGYYEAHQFQPPAQQPQEFVIWSNFKSSVLVVISPIVFPFLITSSVYLVFIYLKKQSRETLLGIFLTLSALVQFGVVLVTEGTFGIPEKHLFLYSIIFDCLLLYYLLAILTWVVKVIQRTKTN